jgi:hypothetical protein
VAPENGAIMAGRKGPAIWLRNGQGGGFLPPLQVDLCRMPPLDGVNWWRATGPFWRTTFPFPSDSILSERSSPSRGSLRRRAGSQQYGRKTGAKQRAGLHALKYSTPGVGTIPT